MGLPSCNAGHDVCQTERGTRAPDVGAMLRGFEETFFTHTFRRTSGKVTMKVLTKVSSVMLMREENSDIWKQGVAKAHQS
jgi:hypothetical protein